MPGTPFFTWPRPWVNDFLTSSKSHLVFIPYAAVTISFDEYEEKVIAPFREMGYTIRSIHHSNDKCSAIKKADAIVVGGGNTFALLWRMYNEGLVEVIRDSVKTGTPYVGWSAGANLACPTIMTTNDMPVVQPPSFEGLNLVPFQINPHYHELKFENQGGETRKERLEEFMMMNPEKKVLGLPEGILLQRNGEKLYLRGSGVAKLYSKGSERPLMPGEDISWLL